MDEATQDFYAAVAKYVEAKGGKVLVIGGVQVTHNQEDRRYNWVLGVKCTGRIPKSAGDEALGGE